MSIFKYTGISIHQEEYSFHLGIRRRHPPPPPPPLQYTLETTQKSKQVYNTRQPSK